MNRNKVMFSILKELDRGNYPRSHDYGIDKETYGEIIELMLDEGLIKNANVTRSGIGNKVTIIFLNHANITCDGLKYLSDNGKWAKTYKGLKEVRDWIPGY